ncbi:MAG: hypothetical protein SGJ11_04740 [Phycisphaerae bacterium]|nr:hypothetical protein [Phycisphaerae bacterium]
MWFALLVAWVAPALESQQFELLQRWDAYYKLENYTAAVGDSPPVPAVAWTDFYGSRHRGLLHAQDAWMFSVRPSPEQALMAVDTGANVTLGFPLGALAADEWVIRSSRFHNPNLGWWQAVCWVIRLPPSPLGFIVDTACWSSGLLVLALLPSAIRRMSRQRRGACPHCGFLRGSGEQCTECGVVFPATRFDVLFPSDEVVNDITIMIAKT